VNTVVSLRVPKHVGKLLSSYTIGDFLRMAQLHGIRLTLWKYNKLFGKQYKLKILLFVAFSSMFSVTQLLFVVTSFTILSCD
jgi:hypothetical protein